MAKTSSGAPNSNLLQLKSVEPVEPVSKPVDPVDKKFSNFFKEFLNE